MLKFYFSFLLVFLMASTANATVWATAVSKNESEGTAIIFRYIKELPKGFVRESQPNRIIITWQYDGDKGMPNSKDLARMYELEDALQLAVEDSGLSTLAIVSTGNGLREWIYYSKSEIKFFEQLNEALGKLKPFPIEIHTAVDPVWKSYEDFQTEVKK